MSAFDQATDVVKEISEFCKTNKVNLNVTFDPEGGLHVENFDHDWGMLFGWPGHLTGKAINTRMVTVTSEQGDIFEAWKQFRPKAEAVLKKYR